MGANLENHDYFRISPFPRGAIGPVRRPFVPDSGCTLLGMVLGRVPPPGSGGRKFFFFTFRLGIDWGSSPTRLEPRRAHISGATGCVPGVWLIPPWLTCACLVRLAILTHSGRASVGVASGHVPVRRFLPPVAILTRFDASFGGAVLRRARHAPPARPQAVRLPRLSAEGVRDGARPDFRASAAHHAPAPEARRLVPSLVVLRCCVYHANCLRRLPRSGPRLGRGAYVRPAPRAISLATWLILPVAYACLKD